MSFKKSSKNDVVAESVSSVFAMTHKDMTCSSTPKVSVVIPAYNVAKFITEALDSVFSQTYKNYEVIVINDGSPDTKELEEILKPYNNKIIYLKQENQGAGAARNAGIYKSSGDLIAFLDADDLWLPEFLESQTAFLENNKLDMVWADAYLFGEPSFAGRTFMQVNPSIGESTLESLLDLKCNVITSGTVVKKDAVIAVNGFDKKNISSEDFDLWTRMASNGTKLGYQRKVLLMHRCRYNGLSGNLIQKIKKSIDVYSHILSNMKLEDRHIIIIKKQLNRQQSRLRIIQGKIHLINGDFKKAVSSFRDANKFYRSTKITFVILMLHIAPQFSLYVYNLLRRHEVKSIINLCLIS